MTVTSEQPTSSGSGRVLFLVASAALNAMNFLFHIITSRSLGPDDYSALGALLALIVVASVPLSAVQLACAQAQARVAADVGIGRTLRRTTAVALGLFVVSVASAPLLNSALHIRGLGLAALVGSWIALSTIATVPQGVLIGAVEFRWVAIAIFVGGGLSRIAVGFIAGAEGGGVAGAMAATVVAQALTLGLLLVPVRRRLSSKGNQLEPSSSDGVLSVGALTGLAAFTAIDTVVARNTLSSSEAGIYVAAATAGRISLFVPGALALMIFPQFSAAAERGEASERLLWRSAALVLAIGLVAAAVLALVPNLAIRILFGSEYSGSTGPLPILAVTGALLGALNLFSYFHIAHRAWAAVVGWMGTALIGLGVLLRPSIDPRSLALSMLGITAACLLLSISAALLSAAPKTENQVFVPAMDLESGMVIPTTTAASIELP